MSRIISPTPIVLTINYNEMTGEVQFKPSRDIPVLTLVVIFCDLLSTLVKTAAKLPVATPPPPGVLPPS